MTLFQFILIFVIFFMCAFIVVMYLSFESETQLLRNFISAESTRNAEIIRALTEKSVLLESKEIAGSSNDVFFVVIIVVLGLSLVACVYYGMLPSTILPSTPKQPTMYFLDKVTNTIKVNYNVDSVSGHNINSEFFILDSKGCFIPLGDLSKCLETAKSPSNIVLKSIFDFLDSDSQAQKPLSDFMDELAR